MKSKTRSTVEYWLAYRSKVYGGYDLEVGYSTLKQATKDHALKNDKDLKLVKVTIKEIT